MRRRAGSKATAAPQRTCGTCARHVANYCAAPLPPWTQPEGDPWRDPDDTIANDCDCYLPSTAVTTRKAEQSQ